MMGQFDIEMTVGDIVTRQPGLSRVFERLGIDYCCGGKRSLKDACMQRSVDPQVVLTMLGAEHQESDAGAVADVSAMTLTEFVDHIERTHHTYVKSESPRLCVMAEKVASVHGTRDGRLVSVRDTLIALADEMASHMMKEECVLFPLIRRLESGAVDDLGHYGTVVGPINQMEAEHANAGIALASLRSLTDDYTPPEWACNAYRALLDGLQQFERDLHQHVHKENNVLFPRAMSLEAGRLASS
jgi:regulator of cell morphogenesis and NO signaling